MNFFFPASTPLRPRDMTVFVHEDGKGSLFTGSGHFSVTTASDAQQIAVRFLQLANAMEAAQDEKGAVA